MSATLLTTHSPQTVEWLGLRLQVPPSWEIVRHSTSVRKGSLIFADAQQQRLQVIWTACAKRPDVSRLLADHRARQLEQDPDARFEPYVLPAGWRGTARLGDERVVVRAVRFDPTHSRLIEAVFETQARHTPEPSEMNQVLASLRVIETAERSTRLQAFGLNVTQLVPPEQAWCLTHTNILPADVTLGWRPRADLGRELPRLGLTVRRRAMAEVWFDGDLSSLLQSDHPRVAMAFSHTVIDGHEGVTAQWDVPGPRYQRLLNRHQRAEATAWHCPNDNAVLVCTMISPAREPSTPADWRVTSSGLRASGGDDA